MGDALEEIGDGFGTIASDAGMALSKRFLDIRILMTRFEASNPLHTAMMRAFRNVFGADVCQSPIKMTRAAEQSGRFQMSVYEQDYREMTRETWKRARLSFDNAHAEFKGTMLRAWKAKSAMREVK